MTEEKNDSNPDTRSDDYGNLITGLAGPGDKDMYNFWQDPIHLRHTILSNMFTGGGLNQRIVGKLVDDATRGGFEIEGKTVEIDMEQVGSDFEDLRIVQKANKLGKTSRLYGGALLYADVEDGGEPDDELDFENISEVHDFKVIPSFRAYPQGYNSSMGLEGWMHPEYYRITSDSGDSLIHSSRIYRLDAIQILDPEFLRWHQGWGPSVLESVFGVLGRLSASEQYMGSLLHNMSMMIVKIPDIHRQICGGPDQAKKGEQALEAIRTLADNYHWMALGANDEVIELKRDLSGFKDVSEKMVEAAIRETGMARIIFSGEQAGGLHSNASDEIRGWYDLVDIYREETLKYIYNWMVKIYMQSRANNDLVALDKWTIGYPSLWQEDPKTERDIQKTTAETWNTYVSSLTALIDAEVYSKQEVKTLLNHAMKELKFPLDPSFIPIVVKPIAASGSIEQASEEEANIDDEAIAEMGDLPLDPITTKEAGLKWPISTIALNNMCRNGELRYWKVKNKYIISMSEMLKSIQGGEAPVASMDSTNLVRALRTDGMDSIGLFIRVPKEISKKFPKIKEIGKDVPHHITVAIFEDAYWNKAEFVRLVEEGLSEIEPFIAEIKGTDSFPNKPATFAPVEFAGDFESIRGVLISMLKSHGFKVSEKYPEWVPHMTLSYEGEYEGETPDETFEVSKIEIWGLGNPIKIDL